MKAYLTLLCILVYAAVVLTKSPTTKICLKSLRHALNCSNGTFNCETERCECEAGFTGRTCSTRLKNGTTPARNETAGTKGGRHASTTVTATTDEPLLTPGFQFRANGNKLCVNGRRVVQTMNSVNNYGETGASCHCSREICVNFTYTETKFDPCKRPNSCFPGKCFRVFEIHSVPIDVDGQCSCLFKDKLKEVLDLDNYTPVCHVCALGTWGSLCREKCGMCRGPCHPIEGCSACAPGWTAPPKCNRLLSCEKGPNKATNCHSGVCVHNDYYNANVCHCFDGFSGFDCATFLPAKNRNVSAYNCTQSTGCERSGGRCTLTTPENIQLQGGETVYWPLLTCLCPPGKYFDGRNCNEGCLESKATCMFGKCVENNPGISECVCLPGYEGRNCSISCSLGESGRYRSNPRYGKQCRRECGRCFQLPCDPVDGSCGPFGCYPGWKGNNCRKPDLRDVDIRSKVIVNVGLTLGGAWKDEFRKKNSTERTSLLHHINDLSAAAIRKANFDFLEEYLEWRAEINSILRGSVQVDYFILFEPRALRSVENIDNKFGVALKKSRKVLKGTGYRLLPDSVKVKTVSRPPQGNFEETENASDDGRSNIRKLLLLILVGILPAGCIVLAVVLFLRKRLIAKREIVDHRNVKVSRYWHTGYH